MLYALTGCLEARDTAQLFFLWVHRRTKALQTILVYRDRTTSLLNHQATYMLIEYYLPLLTNSFVSKIIQIKIRDH